MLVWVSTISSLCTDLTPCGLLAAKWYPAASHNSSVSSDWHYTPEISSGTIQERRDVTQPAKCLHLTMFCTRKSHPSVKRWCVKNKILLDFRCKVAVVSLFLSVLFKFFFYPIMNTPCVLEEFLFTCWYRISTLYWPLHKFGYRTRYWKVKHGIGTSLVLVLLYGIFFTLCCMNPRLWVSCPLAQISRKTPTIRSHSSLHVVITKQKQKQNFPCHQGCSPSGQNIPFI